MIAACPRPEAIALKRGLCMSCYSKAKKAVESGQTTWDALEKMGLCRSYVIDPFTAAFEQAKQEQPDA